MLAAMWMGGRRIEMQEVPTPVPGPNELLIRVRAASLCGSDLDVETFGGKPPLILGHEAAGEVAAVGSMDPLPEGAPAPPRPLRVGDRVALDPVQPCWRCQVCRSGIHHLCPNVRHLATRDVPGTFAEYVIVHHLNAHLLPDGIGFEEAALTEPGAVCLEGIRRGRLSAGEDAVVIGDGPFGFIFAQLARSAGASRLLVAGHYEQRLKTIAAATGATTVNTHKEDLIDRVRESTEGEGAHVVFQATAAHDAINLGLHCLRPRGRHVVFSYMHGQPGIDMATVLMKELEILGSVRSHDTCRVVHRMVQAGRLNLRAVISRVLPLDQLGEAMDLITSKKAEVFKIVLTPPNV
jgi:threonine dehydrogenase-like Zn-dependent dehydrogenase